MPREHYDSQLKELDARVLEMGDLVAHTIAQCVDVLESLDVDAAQQLIEADNQIDQQRYDIENEALLLIATQQPLAGDLRVVAAILTIATELERIGDYCEGIAELTLRMASEPVAITGSDIRSMALFTQRLLRQSLEAYRDRNVEMAGEVWTEDDNVDRMYEQVFRSMIAGMIADRSTIRSRTYLLWVAHNIERMADRVTNIAERVSFVVTGDVAAFRDRLRSQTVPG
jgi:phosphate transport system protein